MSADPKPAGGTRQRLITGVIAFVLVLPLLSLGTPLTIGGLGFLAAAICMHEYTVMAMPGHERRAWPLMLGLGFVLFLGAALTASWLQGAVVAAVMVSAVVFLLTARTTDGLADRWVRFVFGLLYLSLTIGLWPALRAQPNGLGWTWVPLLVAWGGDIGGYFAGRAFGKHKMAPLISPKKTWEGFVGGLALGIVALSIQKLLFFGELTWLDCLVLGVFGGGAGVFGDLTISMLKRTWGIKDTGNILPGHGGLLDRIDSVIWTIPTVWLWAGLLRPGVGL